VIRTYFDGTLVHVVTKTDAWGYRYWACSPSLSSGGPYVDWKTWAREGDVPTCLECLAKEAP
jgi:hypothetical protein